MTSTKGFVVPAGGGSLVEEMLDRPVGPSRDDERNERLRRHRRELVGPNPL